MDNYFEDFIKNKVENTVHFYGVVEDNNDPMNLGRVRVRCFHYHTDDTTEIPTEALPWAMVFTPTTSASISGIGESPNGLERGSWVYGFFMDGRDAQYPVVTHSIPGIHRPESPGNPGGTSSGFLNGEDYYSGDTAQASENLAPYHNQGISSDGRVDNYEYTNPAAQGEGALTAVGDINMMLQPKDGSRFKQLGLVTYSHLAAPNGYACKDGKNSLRFHYGTALALEKLTKMKGSGKFYITSAYRTPAYNARQRGAAKNSLHTQGRALDIAFNSIGGSSKANLAAFGKMAVKCGFVGFGIYWSSGFIHIDTGSGRVWNGAKEAWFVNAIKSAGWFPGKKGLSGVSVNQGSEEETVNPDGTPTNVTTTNDAEKYVYDRLKAEGYTDVQAAAVMGHLREESSFNPGAIGDNGDAYGIAQWNDRREALFKWTGTRNPSLKQQVDFMVHELNTSEKRSGMALRSATTLSGASRAFAGYERYRGYNDPNSASSKKRIDHAQKYLTGQSFPNAQIAGFTDPTNSLPTPEYRGEPSTHMNARGFNSLSNQERILEKDAARMTGFPAAGEIGTFGEPELKAAPQYPYNHTKTTRTGHILEMDDTPGAERVNFEHSTGSSLEMFADGSVTQRSKANQYTMVGGDQFHGVMGKFFQTSVNDMHIRSTADMTLQSDGAMNIHMGNDGSMSISGDYLISVGDEVKIRATKIVFEATESIDILSHKTVNIEGRSGVTIKSDKAVEIQGGSAVGVKAPTVYMDDVVRVGEDGAKAVAGADSADLGPPPPRKTIEKDQLKNSSNKKGSVTTEEAYDYYSQIKV